MSARVLVHVCPSERECVGSRVRSCVTVRDCVRVSARDLCVSALDCVRV